MCPAAARNARRRALVPPAQLTPVCASTEDFKKMNENGISLRKNQLHCNNCMRWQQYHIDKRQQTPLTSAAAAWQRANIPT
jgi:hypothetical protein